MSSLAIAVAGSGAYCVVLGFFLALCKAAGRPAPRLDQSQRPGPMLVRPDGPR